MKKTKVIRKEALPVQAFEIVVSGVAYEYVIQQPTFEQLSLATSQMIKSGGTMDVVSPGKIIFDTCCVEHTEGMELEPSVLIKICIGLTTEYVQGFDYEIKKK